MSPVSAMVFAVFGGVWIMLAIFSQREPIPALSVIPLIISGAIVWSAIRAQKSQIEKTPDERARTNKIVMYASIFEGVAIFIGLNILDNIGRPDLYLPGLALVVGLHFLPFARYIPDRRYYGIAAAMIAAALAGWAIQSQNLRTGLVGISCGLLLWGAAAVAIREASTARARGFNPHTP
jgi:Mg2+/citrate symporter